jgi:hypothetical protein
LTRIKVCLFLIYAFSVVDLNFDRGLYDSVAGT